MTRRERSKRRRIRRQRRRAVVVVAILLVALSLAVRADRGQAEDEPREIVAAEIHFSPRPELLAERARLTEAESILPSESLEPTRTPLGTYRITAYCACEICCGEWAKNRPGGVVYGAGGVELVAGTHCASTLPFGTCLYIEGMGEYVVQDRFATWIIEEYGENVVDIYFSDHQAALEFGVKYLQVYTQERSNGV